ncbi:endoplasmic reticulum metallopeptidase 1-like [Drosophila nasuta]|uniref:endoplasmic reticulum metallopeptidase 1-like n=1 Tax=Drosophila nasuta TaxID=42062 RepID=UPI00295F4EDB|nr:endoplasmic reticulum metallopeptidase 1-like [Drosophila nasuta]
MGDKALLITNEHGKGPFRHYSTKESATKGPWYCGIMFLLFWAVLFFSVVFPLFFRLPTVLHPEEDSGKGKFIGERAYKTLNDLNNIGPRVTGSNANEVDTINFLLNEIEDIRANMLEEYFTLETDVQITSGSHIYSSLLEMYQGVQNVVVKLSSKNSTSESYLLVNSHFDTVLTSPGASDDGFMVATMLEVLRVMATSEKYFEHPVVFLFNGDEEMGMQASHGFITQHKWAKNCKAFINLEGAGGAGREIVFQTGPYHPWLTNYYKKSAKHPFATTLAEEIFQSGLIPSDTDYRIFVQYGDIPGFDFAQMINGYVLHSKYDRIDVIPRGAIQNSGDNVLELVWALSNAPEMRDTNAYRTGHAVFFDFLGLYFFNYTEDTGKILNYSAGVVTLLLILVSACRMSAFSNLSCCQVLQRLIILSVVQIIALVFAMGIPLTIAYVIDNFGLSLSYFSATYLIIGLYICPSLFGLSLPTMIYYQLQQNSYVSFTYHLQLGLHSWALIVSGLVLSLTEYGIRSVYILTIILVFYAISLALNLLTTFHDSGYNWTWLHISSQVIPFLNSSYVIYIYLLTMPAISGRSGSASNPDIIISVLSALLTVLCFGFLAPLINMFRRPSIVVFSLFLVSAIAMYLASCTQIGFPYRPKTNPERVMYQHVRKIFYEYDGSISQDESGYLFNFQDRREDQPYTGVNLTGSTKTKSECEKHMMCGLPLFDERWVGNRLQGMWLPRETIEPPSSTTLELLNKTVLENNKTVRFNFRLSGPPHLNLYIQPREDDFVTITDWSFSQDYLKNPPITPLSYHIFITFGIVKPPLEFFLDISKPSGDFNVPLFQLGVSGHYLDDEGDTSSQKFASTFPSHTVLIHWPSLYQRYIF